MSIQSPLQSTADPPAAFQSLTHTQKRKIREILCNYKRVGWELIQAQVLGDPDEQLWARDIAVVLELASSASNSSQFRSSL